jgi:hypothetical protein
MTDEQTTEPIFRLPRVMVNRRIGSDAEGWRNEWMPATSNELLDALQWHLENKEPTN